MLDHLLDFIAHHVPAALSGAVTGALLLPIADVVLHWTALL